MAAIVCEPTVLSSELTDALQHFKELFDPASIDARQPPSPAMVYTPSVVVWLMVYQRLHGNATLEEAVDELLRMTEELPANRLPANRRIAEGTLSSNTGSYSQARKRLDVRVANDLADSVFDTLMRTMPPSWQNRRVFIVDGTTNKLSSSDVLRLLYPPATNQYGSSVWPILHWSVAHELSSGCAVRPELGAKFGPNAIGEVDLASGLLQRIPAKSVLMADRNFGVFAFYYRAQQAGFDVMTRLTELRFRSMVKKAEPDGPGRWNLLWRPTRPERKNHPELPVDAAVRVVLHERMVMGSKGEQKPLYLVTTLLLADGESLAALYKQRQNVESDIRDVKIALKMEELRSRSGAMIGKEVALGMIAYNLVVQVRRLAAKRIDVEPRRLSFTGVWSLVKTILLSPNDWTWEEYNSKFEQVLRWAAQRKLPNRPGREFPRKVLRRARKFTNRERKPEELTLK